MTSPAVEPRAPRITVLVEGSTYELMDVLEVDGDRLARVRTPFLFEIGEELAVRVERNGTTIEAVAKIRAHVGPADARITELELSPRKPV